LGKIAHGSYHDKNDLTGHGFWACSYYGDFRNPESDEDFMETWHNLISLDEPKLKSPSKMRIVDPDNPESAPSLKSPQNMRIVDSDNPGIVSEPKIPRNVRIANLDNPGSWIEADRIGGWLWGPDGISNHPTQNPPEADMRACKGPAIWWPGADGYIYELGPGCYKSECLAGDDQTAALCLKECEPGYTNHGLTCGDIGWKIWEWRAYGRLNPGKSYGYNYILPRQDAGLARRRSKYINIHEWGLPRE